jgi:hypothetical protein
VPNFDAIAEAVAARYAAGTLAPPAGLDAIGEATADLPNHIGQYPTLLVFLDAGALDAGQGTRIGVSTFLARFYFADGLDLEGANADLRRWLTVLVDAHKLSVQLGGVVDVVRTVAWRAGILHYGGADHVGLELTVRVWTSEAWEAVA